MRVGIWVSVADSRPEASDDWLLAGEVDPHPAGDITRDLQEYLGVRAFRSRRSFGFYGNFDPTSEGHAAVFNAAGARSGIEFWLQLRLDGPPRERTFTTQRKVETGPLELRPHEPHPGLLRPAEAVGMRLHGVPGAGLFDLD